MGGLMDLRFFPGPVVSDVEPHLLKENEWQSVINMRMDKFGSLSNVNRLHESFSGSAIKAMEEFTEDKSGSRFILFQDGTDLKRVDYDADDGDGYENETPSTLSLPSGVTIPSNVTCRFFFYKGVIRIVGPIVTATGVAAPLWYGYVFRKLFEGSWEFIDISGAWTCYDSTQASDPIGGFWALPGLEITQTGLDGSLRKSFTIISGRTFKVRMYVKRASGGSGHLKVKLGTTLDGSEYATLDIHPTTAWAALESSEIVATSNTLHVSVNPELGASGSIASIDCLDIMQESSIDLSEWLLVECSLKDQGVVSTLGGGYSEPYPEGSENSEVAADYFYFKEKISTIYDGSQYTLSKELSSGNANKLYFARTYSLHGAGLREAFPNKRMTGFAAVLGTAAFGHGTNPDELPLYVKEMIYFDLKPSITKNYVRSGSNKKCYYDSASHGRLYFVHGASDEWMQGDQYLIHNLKLKLTNSSGVSLQTYILEVNFTSGVGVDHIVLADSVDALCGGSSGYVDLELEVEYFYWYHALEGYHFPVSMDTQSLANEFYALTQIPAGTKSLACKFSWMAFVGERAWVVSEEDGQLDQYRYTPIYQFDSFPETLIAPNKSGDADRNKVIVNIGDRIIGMKENVITQVQYSNGGFYLDIGLEHRGLFAMKGFLVLDGVLIFMDKDDVYQFQSGSPVPMISKANLRKYYMAYRTTSSFMAYDRNLKEVWFVLDYTHILVYQLEFDNWFVRETSYVVLGAFTDFDGSLKVFTATKMYSMGSTSTDDEPLRILLVGRDFGRETIEKFKKALRSLVDGDASAATHHGPWLKLYADNILEEQKLMSLVDNELTDESYETSASMSVWTGTDATATATAGSGTHGKACAKIETTVSGGYAIRSKTGFVVGQKFHLQFSAMVGSLPATGHKIRVGTPSDDDAYGEFTLAAGDTWQLMEVRDTFLHTTINLKVIPATGIGASLYIDRFQLRAEERELEYAEFDTPAMFHKLRPEIETLPTVDKTMTFRSMVIKIKDWNLARKPG
jgi:hypothetical protein